MERTITGDFHEKSCYENYIAICTKNKYNKKTIAHKVYKILLIATLIPDFGSIGEI